MEDFFYGIPKWAGYLIVAVVVILIIGLLGYSFLG